MRIKLEGIQFNVKGTESREGRGQRNVDLQFGLGNFEYELSVEEAVELAKLSGMTIKEILGSISDLASKAVQYKREQNNELLEENLALKCERDNLKSQLEMEKSRKDVEDALKAMKANSKAKNDDGEDSYI